MLLDGGFGVNIIIKQLRLRLGLPKPKPAPYNLRMADQTTLVEISQNVTTPFTITCDL
jgi:hypothetical protein